MTEKQGIIENTNILKCLMAGAKRHPFKALLMLLAAFLAVIVFSVLGGWLVARNSQQVPVLVYHNLSATENPADTSARVFEEEMRFLHDNGYHVVPLKQLISFMESNSPLPEKPVVITFDDGYKSNYTYAYPVLKQYSTPATIFMIGSAVGDSHMLTWDEMREMEKSGQVDIQSHTYDLHHEVFSEPTLEIAKPAAVKPAYLPNEKRYETKEEFENKFINDLVKSREVIETNLNKKVDTLCWPYGAFNHNVLRLAQQAGFNYFLTLESGMNRKGDPRFIRRIDCEGNIPISRFTVLVEPDRSLKGYIKQLIFDYQRRAKEIHNWGW